MPGGRHSSFRDEFVVTAHQLSLLGYSDARIARVLGLKVGSDTDNPLRRWKARFPAFATALARGREVSSGRVAASLYERAIGYSHPATKVFPPRKSGDPPIVVPYTERFPPDVEAAKFILTNREPDLWSNKQTIEHNVSDKLADRLEAARLRMIERLQTPVIESTTAEVVGESMDSSAESAGEPQQP